VHSLVHSFLKNPKNRVHKVHILVKRFSEKAAENPVFTHFFDGFGTKFENKPLLLARWGGRGRKFKSCHSDQYGLC